MHVLCLSLYDQPFILMDCSLIQSRYPRRFVRVGFFFKYLWAQGCSMQIGGTVYLIISSSS